MGFFIEMRCELRGEGRGEGENRCYSDDNADLMANSSDTHKSVISVIRSLEKDARKNGWKKIRGIGWVCPNCQNT